MKVKICTYLAVAACSLTAIAQLDAKSISSKENYFPFYVTDEKPDIELSAASKRMYDKWDGYRPEENEFFTNFKYTKLEGFDYGEGDGKISRRDPSRVLKVDDLYYIYYTHRDTPTGAMGYTACNDTIPSQDWDLAEVWYATSKDGFTWEEQGVAVPRPPKPQIGWRAVCTPDIFVWKGKYYLYYQAFNAPSGQRGDDCPISASVADSPRGPFIPCNKLVVPTGPEGTWDQYATQDPYPMVHNGKIYMFYKSDFNGHDKNLRAIGLAVADDPLGPFEKSPKNPVLNSGHEIGVFPYKSGFGAVVIRDGNERNTIQYSEDGEDFEIKAIVAMPPVGFGPYMPDSFTGEYSDGITWGICHNKHLNWGNFRKGYSILMRVDCDLSVTENDPRFKETELFETPEEQYRQALTPAQKKKRMEEFKLQ